MQKSFIIIGINSPEESLVFYRDILGFNLEKRVHPADMVELLWMKNENDMILELVHRKDLPPVKNGNSHVTLAFQVDNPEEKKELLNQKSVPFEIMMLPIGVEVIRLKDPNGVSISILPHLD